MLRKIKLHLVPILLFMLSVNIQNEKEQVKN
jgi:hypothetical protein